MTHEAQMGRVEMMASGDPKWDLSPNDIAALKYVLQRVKNLEMIYDAAKRREEELRVVAEAAQALMRTDPRRLDGMTDEAYRAWCKLRDALPVPPVPTGSNTTKGGT